MDKIEVKVLNPEDIKVAQCMMNCCARLTQHGHNIANIDDFMTSYTPASMGLRQKLCEMPHPTLQKFAVINIVIVGASRRFLAQITRHQNEVKFMSASLQYSDYSDAKQDMFAVPYDYLRHASLRSQYMNSCFNAYDTYKKLAVANNDSAGFVMPQGMRNVLVISATPYQWKHMISQRTCRRNSDETRIVMLKIWDELFKLDPVLFSMKTTGAFCQKGKCEEGKMTCGKPILFFESPKDILLFDYPDLFDFGGPYA